MNSSTKTMLAAAIVATAAGLYGCAQFAGIATLRGADAASTDQAPEAKAYAGKRPGAGQAIARTFKEQPPLVPHAVDNFDEITVSENQCMECHSPERHVEKKAPKVADTHLVAASAGTSAVRMDRYQCNSCHVPQVDAAPLVQSTFVGTPVPVRRQ